MSRWLGWGLALLALGAGLTALYFQQSLTAVLNSDGAANMLQAWSMLHGNPLLGHWWTSDVSFYTTELPEYALVEAVAGLTPAVVHLCGALTYTLTVLLTALVARGRHRGLAGVARAVLAGGILLAPGLADGTGVFLENPDHAGTAVPILLLLLALDRLPARWPTALIAAVLLAWTQVADQLTLAAATVPVAAVALLRLAAAYSGRRASGNEASGNEASGGGVLGGGVLGGGAARRRLPAEAGYDALLLAAAVASVGLARGAEALLRGLGGYDLRPLPSPLLAAPAQIPHNVRVLGQSVLVLFGANKPYGGDFALTAISYFHWTGLVLAVAAFAAAAVTFFARWPDRVSQVVVAGAAVIIAAGIFSTELPDVSHAHEVAVLAPFGAVLAGRVLPDLIRARWRGSAGRPAWLLAALGAWAACGIAALCYGAAWHPAPPAGRALTAWLQSRGLTDGLAGYWQAERTTAESGGRVLVAPVDLGPTGQGTAQVRRWEALADWYDPAVHRATFVIATPPGPLANGIWPATATRMFGRPERTYRVGSDVVMVYGYNLLTRVAGRDWPGTPAELASNS